MTGGDHGDRAAPHDDAWDLVPHGASDHGNEIPIRDPHHDPHHDPRAPGGRLDPVEAVSDTNGQAIPVSGFDDLPDPHDPSLQAESPSLPDAGSPLDLPPIEIDDDDGAHGDVLQAEPLPDPAPTTDESVVSMSPPPPTDVDDVPVDDPPPAFADDPARGDPARGDSARGDPARYQPAPRDVWAPPPTPRDAWASPPAAPADALAPSDPVSARARVKVRASTVSPRVGDKPRYTGQRNEDSILFDMSVVPTRNLREARPAPAAVSDRDSSGLIDISRLAEASAAAAAPRTSRPPVEGLLTVGASAPLAARLAAPSSGGLLAPITPSVAPRAAFQSPPPATVNKTVVFSAAIVALIATTGICSVLVLLHGRESDRGPSAPIVATSGGTPPSEPSSVPPSTALPTPTTPTPPPTSQSAAPVVALAHPVVAQPRNSVPAEVSRTVPSVETPRSARGGGAEARTPAGSRRVRSNPIEAAPSAPAVQYHAPASQGDEHLAESPSRTEVVGAMQSLGVIVRACGTGTEPAMVDITFAGSGRVTTATVRAPYAGTPAGSCIARAVRAARVGPFAQPTFRVSYPFSLQ